MLGQSEMSNKRSFWPFDRQVANILIALFRISHEAPGGKIDLIYYQIWSFRNCIVEFENNLCQTIDLIHLLVFPKFSEFSEKVFESLL